MSTFCLLQISAIKDHAKLKKYTDATPQTVVPYGGELVFRGKVSDTLSGQAPHISAVVIKFPDQASANGWCESKAYQSLIANRDAAAEVIVTRYDEPDFF